MVEIETRVISLIDNKAKEMNPDALCCCDEVSTIVKQLNGYIDGRLNLSVERIEYLLDRLVGWYTITLEQPIDKGLKLRRARKFDNPTGNRCFKKVEELSYIPQNSTIKPQIGRLNKAGVSIFYGCIYFSDFGGFNVAFSEVDALKNEIINILNSETKKEILVRFIGIYDYIRRESKPSFLSEQNYLYLKAVYKHAEEKFDKHLFVAFQLCDAFFSDILRREQSGRLYVVTSILASLFLEQDNVDGLIYTSVKAEGSPVIAIKSKSVDEKICHKTADCFQMQNTYGYAIFNAKPLFHGVVIDKSIDWSKC